MQIKNFDDLTEEEQFVVKWQYQMLGDFKTALVRAITKADTYNMLLLALGFPVEVKAYKRFTQEEGWWEMVAKKAGIDV